MLLFVGTYGEKLGHVHGKAKGVYVFELDPCTLTAKADSSKPFHGVAQLGGAEQLLWVGAWLPYWLRFVLMIPLYAITVVVLVARGRGVAWQRGALQLALFNLAMASFFLVPRLVLGVFDVLSSACGVVAPLYGGIVTGRAGYGAQPLVAAGHFAVLTALATVLVPAPAESVPCD